MGLFKGNFSRNNPSAKITAVYILAFIGLGSSTAIAGATLPSLAENTNVLVAALGTALAGRALGYLSGSLLAGWLYDHQPGHAVMAGATILIAITLLVIPMVHVLWLLVFVFFMVGVSQSILDVGGNILLVWMYGERSGPYLNGLHFAFGAGALAAPLVVAQVIRTTGAVDWAYWSMMILVLSPVLFVLRFPSPQNPGKQQAEEQPISNGSLLVVLFVLFFLFYSGAEVGFGDWVYTYGLESGLADETSAAYLNSAFWAVLSLGRLLGIPVAARMKPRVMLLMNLAGSITSLLLLSVWSDNQAVLWAGTILLAFSLATTFPMTLAYAGRVMRITGRVTSFFYIGGSLGTMLVTWLAGQALGRYGTEAMMPVFLGSICLTVVLFGLILLRVGEEGKRKQ